MKSIKHPKHANFLKILICTTFLLLGASYNAFGSGPEPSRGLISGGGLATVTTSHGKTIYAEIADTSDKRAEGLMHRTSLAPDHGMIFIFPELGYWTFWMKNTKISLDIIWMEKNGKIIYIEHAVPICTRKDDGCPRYHSHKKARYVLEINAGVARKLDLTPGTLLNLSFPKSSLPF